MKVVKVVSYYPPHMGGMENVAREISERLAKKNNQVEVFTSDTGCKKGKLRAAKNLKIHYLKSWEFAHTPIIPSLFFKLLKISKDSIMHVHMGQALVPEVVYLVSKFKKIPYVVQIHIDADPSGYFGFLLAPYKKFILSVVLRNANKVICLTESQAYVITKKYRLKRERVIVVPNGVGNEYFQKKQIKTRNETQILFVGRLAIQKNVACLIKAIFKVKQKVTLHIVGDGEQMGFLKEIVRKKKMNNVIFHGRQDKQAILVFYHTSDIFVLPSINEAMPLVLLEAMASGLPIIASNLPVLHELLHDCGILVKPITAENFALEINALIGDKNLRKRLSEEGKKKAKHYEWDELVEKFEAIYREVLNETN